MALEKFMFGILVFSLILVTGIFIVSDVNTNYAMFGTDINLDQFDPNTTHDFTNELDSSGGDSRTLFDNVFGTTVDTDSSENSLFSGAFSGIRVVQNMIGLIGKMIGVVMTSLGIPGYFKPFGIAAVTLFVTFSVVFLMLRFRG
tara:strand:- start:523 stop:954 length:432 start_codon:yes stop_codon:yes gene_type:complete